MEFGQKGADIPDEMGDQRQRTTGGDTEFGGATADETGMTVSKTSALEHVPQAAEVPADAETRPVSAEGPASTDMIVSSVLGAVERARSERETDIVEAHRLSSTIQGLETRLTGIGRRIAGNEQAMGRALADGRTALWDTMPKADDGFAYGADNVKKAVELSPGENMEEPYIRAGRAAAAEQASSLIKQDIPVAIGYWENGHPAYLGAIPGQDGFSVGFEPDAGRFMVGVGNAVIPVDEAWVGRPPNVPRDDEWEGQPWVVRQTVEIRAGDDVAPYLRSKGEQALIRMDTTGATIRAGRYDTLSSGAREDLVRDQRLATEQAVDAIYAAREAGVLLYDPQSHGPVQMAVVRALTKRLIEVGDEPRVPDDVTLLRIGEALQYIYPSGTTRSFADHLIASSHTATRTSKGGHSRAAIADVLVAVCGMDEETVAAALYTN